LRTLAERGQVQEAALPVSLAALGVVFGDIGTSPIYGFKACFAGPYSTSPSAADIYGVVSLIVWALTITVSIKYVSVIMRADNHGEGGILALLALLRGGRSPSTMPPGLKLVIGLGLFGAALLYGDGVITPAISVLSAVEGLGVATPELAHLAVPLSVGILFALFAVQRFGTARVGGVFGPVMLIWFVAIAVAGVRSIVASPEIFAALSPWYGIQFFLRHGLSGIAVLGAVVLAVTGAEALYADMGFFGKRPIRMAWFGVVFPALLLNYAGQGALMLRDKNALANPFFLLAPRGLLYPYVALATVATIVASQALISGVFALTNQSILLGYMPRIEVRHTDAQAQQVYMPGANWVLMIACLLLVVTFRSSTALGAAYGIAVSGTMAMTTVLFYAIARTRWKWSRLRAGTVAGFFLVVDCAFAGANTLKVAHGGWVPLAIAVVLWTLMTTWASGREALLAIRRREGTPLDEFFARLKSSRVTRTPGTAVFLTSHVEGAPRVLTRQVELTHALPKHVVIVTIAFEEVPTVDETERLEIQSLGHGLFRVTAHYGFLEEPHLPQLLNQCRQIGIPVDLRETTYYLNGERLVLAPDRNPLRRWRKELFRFLARNSRSAPDFFDIPPNQVVELGSQVII